MTLSDGGLVDVSLALGRIASVAPAGSLDPSTTAPTIFDLPGFLLLPAPVEPHAHLDKALTADLVPNPAGDLLGAILAYQSCYHERTVAEIMDRARRAALTNLANGCTAIRTHVDLDPALGLRGVSALLALRDELADRVDIQIVGLAGRPTSGVSGQANRELIESALAAGIDVVGGCPHLDEDPAATVQDALERARRHGRPLDLHSDENLEPNSVDLQTLASALIHAPHDRPVAASHCVSLGMVDSGTQARIADATAAAGISVITLPQTNLFLQSRGVRTAVPRGLTAVAALLEAGVNVAAGGDNLQDPFNVVGRGDPLETASLHIAAAHLTPERAYHAISTAARRALGLEAVTITAGAPAELLAIRAANVREAIAGACEDRLVFHAGKLVARTTLTREMYG